MIAAVERWFVRARRAARTCFPLPFLVAATIAAREANGQVAGVAPATRHADTASLVVQNRTVFVFRAPLGAAHSLGARGRRGSADPDARGDRTA